MFREIEKHSSPISEHLMWNQCRGWQILKFIPHTVSHTCWSALTSLGQCPSIFKYWWIWNGKTFNLIQSQTYFWSGIRKHGHWVWSYVICQFLISYIICQPIDYKTSIISPALHQQKDESRLNWIEHGPECKQWLSIPAWMPGGAAEFEMFVRSHSSYFVYTSLPLHCSVRRGGLWACPPSVGAGQATVRC